MSALPSSPSLPRSSMAGVRQAASPKPLPLERVDGRIVSLLNPASFEAEQYRALGHELVSLNPGAATVVAVSSPTAGDGKTTTAINLAVTLGQYQHGRVLLIDADLRRPAVMDRLGLPGASSRPGLAEAVREPRSMIASAPIPLAAPNLWLLTAGRSRETPYRALASARVGELFDAARSAFRYVVVDTPPIVPVADCRALAEWVDGFLIVVAAHGTSRRLLGEALSALDAEKTLGIVFNGDDRHGSRSYRRYYYGYGAPRRESLWRRLLG